MAPILPTTGRPDLARLLPRDPAAYGGPVIALWLSVTLRVLATGWSLVRHERSSSSPLHGCRISARASAI